jgi:Tryptophan-associated transmembrane protein (Trp_oprn_chp)
MNSRALSLGLLALAGVCGFAGESADSAGDSAGDSATGVGVLALASVAAVFAVPPRGRPVLGALLVVAGVVVGAAEWTSEGATDVLLTTSLLALTASGLLIAFRGPRWPALARRYGGADSIGHEPEDLWRALDRGVDPTADAPQPSDGEPGPQRPTVD